MAVQDVKELIRRMVEAFDRGDVSDVESSLGPGERELTSDCYCRGRHQARALRLRSPH